MMRSNPYLNFGGSLFAHLLRLFAENAWRCVLFLQVILPGQSRDAGDFGGLLNSLIVLAALTLGPPILLAPFARYLVGQRQSLSSWALVSIGSVAAYRFVPTLNVAYLSLAGVSVASSLIAVHRMASVPTWSIRLQKSPIEIHYLFLIAGTIGTLVGFQFYAAQDLGITSLIVAGALGVAFVGYEFATAPIAPIASFLTDVKTLRGWFAFRVAFFANVLFMPLVLMMLTLVVFPASGEWPTWERFRPLEGIALGIGLCFMQQNGHRMRGLFWYWMPLFLGFLLYAFFTGAWNNLGLWLTIGGIFTTVRLTYSIEAETAIGSATALLHAVGAILTFVMLGTIVALGSAAMLHQVLPWAIIGLSCVYVLIFCYYFSRQAFETFVEIVMWPMYRIEAVGPGIISVPLKGPYLVLANHACWLDPFWIAKVITGPTRPMMTASFYDIPVLEFFMRRLITAIRVIEQPYRRETPELLEAIAALKRGQSIMLFPEGYLRRKEEVPIRRFGRGVWEILKEVPDVPIVVCWIEGGWQSFTSFYNGPPTKNKKLDFRRVIRIAVSNPEPIDPQLLLSHHATRQHLMERVAQIRTELDLPAIDLNRTIRDEEATE